jgi:hypothetical protein
MQTARGISAWRASSIPAAARGGLSDRWSVSSGDIIFRIDEGRIRDEERSGGGSSLLDGVGDVLEDGQVEMCLASLLGVCSTNNLGS